MEQFPKLGQDIPEAEKADMSESPVSQEEMREAVEALNENENIPEAKSETGQETNKEFNLFADEEALAGEKVDFDKKRQAEGAQIEKIRSELKEGGQDRIPPTIERQRGGGDGDGPEGRTTAYLVRERAGIKASVEMHTKFKMCERCAGKGRRFIFFKCPQCKGTGRVPESQTQTHTYSATK